MSHCGMKMIVVEKLFNIDSKITRENIRRCYNETHQHRKIWNRER